MDFACVAFGPLHHAFTLDLFKNSFTCKNVWPLQSKLQEKESSEILIFPYFQINGDIKDIFLFSNCVYYSHNKWNF